MTDGQTTVLWQYQHICYRAGKNQRKMCIFKADFSKIFWGSTPILGRGYGYLCPSIFIPPPHKNPGYVPDSVILTFCNTTDWIALFIGAIQYLLLAGVMRYLSNKTGQCKPTKPPLYHILLTSILC